MGRNAVIGGLAAVLLAGTASIAWPVGPARGAEAAVGHGRPAAGEPIAGNLVTKARGMSPALKRTRYSLVAVKGQLLGVSALSASDAWAVGQDKNRTFILHWNGVYWLRVPSPDESAGKFREDVLGSVSVVSARDAWAVGIVATKGFDAFKDLIEHWNGTKWTIVPSPSPSSPSGYVDQLSAVAALSGNDAWAVGGDANGSLIVHWNGRSWQQVPNVPGNGYLNSITVISRADAWAVGYVSQNGGNQDLILHWNGKSWQRVPCPSPGQLHNTAGDDLYGVAASSARNVWAVGLYTANAKASGERTLVLRWTGKAWVRVPSPNPVCKSCDSGASLSAVATTGADNVWAVGNAGGISSQNLAEHWNGRRWTIERTPDLDPGSLNQLAAVTAISAKLAWVVGDNLIAQWNGAGWVVADTPSLTVSPGRGLPGTSITVTGTRFQPGEKVTVTDASAAGAAICAATAAEDAIFTCAGKIPAAVSGPQQLVATGKTSGAQASVAFAAISPWKFVRAPLPPGAAADPDVTMYSMACPAPSRCQAAGSYRDKALFSQGLFETWSGSSWRSTLAPLPVSEVADQLVSVACPEVSSCVAAGNSWDYSGYSSALLETLSGSTWSAALAPTPAGAFNSLLQSVACSPGSSLCAASGTYIDPSNHIHGLLETSSVTGWEDSEAPLPQGAASGDSGVSLPAIACASGSTCLAIGSYLDSSRRRQGLLETLSGGTWTAQVAPLPPGASTKPDVSLAAISCLSPVACVAVGNYTRCRRRGARPHRDVVIRKLDGADRPDACEP